MIRGLAVPGRTGLVARLSLRPSRTPRVVVDDDARAIAARLLARRSRRERLVIALVLVDGLRVLEAAAALDLSAAQVDRTLASFLGAVTRAVRRAHAPSRRARTLRRAA